MKKSIGIAMCIVMLAGAAQVSAQQESTANGKQKTEQKSDRQAPGQNGSGQKLSPDDMAKNRADRMKEQLSLSDDQYAKVLDLNKAQAEQFANSPRPSREQMQNMTDEQKSALRDKMKKTRDEYNAKLKGILTPEQYAKYEENMKNARHRGHGRHGGQQAAPTGGEPTSAPQGGQPAK